MRIHRFHCKKALTDGNLYQLQIIIVILTMLNMTVQAKTIHLKICHLIGSSHLLREKLAYIIIYITS